MAARSTFDYRKVQCVLDSRRRAALLRLESTKTPLEVPAILLKRRAVAEEAAGALQQAKRARDAMSKKVNRAKADRPRGIIARLRGQTGTADRAIRGLEEKLAWHDSLVTGAEQRRDLCLASYERAKELHSEVCRKHKANQEATLCAARAELAHIDRLRALFCEKPELTAYGLARIEELVRRHEPEGCAAQHRDEEGDGLRPRTAALIKFG